MSAEVGQPSSLTRNEVGQPSGLKDHTVVKQNDVSKETISREERIKGVSQILIGLAKKIPEPTSLSGHEASHITMDEIRKAFKVEIMKGKVKQLQRRSAALMVLWTALKIVCIFFAISLITTAGTLTGGAAVLLALAILFTYLLYRQSLATGLVLPYLVIRSNEVLEKVFPFEDREVYIAEIKKVAELTDDQRREAELALDAIMYELYPEKMKALRGE